MNMSLLTKYRPQKFSEVVGHRETVQSIVGVLKKSTCRAFTFTGPSGTGKTTLARVIARAVNCQAQNLMEIDAATHTGVDAMRNVCETALYKGMGGSATRVYIIDEAHMLSKAAWSSLLKSTEDSGVYWMFCSTEGLKIPETIRTRCVCYELKPVSHEDIATLIERVAEAESINIDGDVVDVIAQKAEGSPRRALSFLAQCANVRDRKEALAIVQSVTDSEESTVADLCRALLKNEPWQRVIEKAKALKDENPESIRIAVCSYMQKVLLSGNGKPTALLSILAAFATPYPQAAGFASLLLSIGDVCFARN